MESTLAIPAPGEPASGATPGAPAGASDGSTERHIRGSSLLLVGRMLGLGLNLLAQVVAVRFFSKSDYGALAYGLSVATLGSTLSSIGLDKAASRFIPIYREHRDWARMFGAMWLMTCSVLGLGIAVIVTVLGMQGLVSQSLQRDPTAASLLLVLILLAPVGAFDNLLVSLFAVFSGARAIFFRKHLLGPLLKLGATLLVVGLHGDVQALAWGTVAAGILGTGIYALTLRRILARQGLLQHAAGWRDHLPVREIFLFALPIFGSDMVFFLRNTLVVMLLQHFKDASAVASYQAVVPAARLNIVVRDSFAYLFVPMAAKLFARGDRAGIDDLYCRTTTWVSLLSFPIFIVTFALAKPLTVQLFGERYADSSRILAFLAAGQFLNASAGLSVLTLRVLGRIRTIIAIDVAITALSLTLNLTLIPRYGAFGAAIATCGTLAVHSLLNFAGLYHAARISILHRRYLWFFASVLLGTAAVVLVQQFLRPPLVLGAAWALAVIVGVAGINRHLLEVDGTFPMLMRYGVLRRLFARRPPDAPAGS
jgi:O-antigen/teichoic acid export membrane protein